MGFNATWVTEPLEYDFRPFVDAHGTIPEPSQRLIDKYNRKFLALMQAVQAAEADPKKVAAAQPKFTKGASLTKLLDEWEKFDSDPSPEADRYDRALVELTAMICGDSPTADQISGLPGRQRKAFISWVRDEMTNPKLHSGVTPLPEATPAA